MEVTNRIVLKASANLGKRFVRMDDASTRISGAMELRIAKMVETIKMCFHAFNIQVRMR